MSLLSDKPYKGSRDFFPEEMRSRDWMFRKLGETAEKFGFEKIDAPLIEPIEIYLAKTSEEIVSQQIYSFKDRGERTVAIRPEMTPTVSRMVAQKFRELPKPVKWYCLPNLWRYERPGKGRLREHWQLNCDIFGADDEFAADVEIIQLAVETLLAFGAKAEHFRVRISNRLVLNSFFSGVLKLPQADWNRVARIMDKKDKVDREAWEKMLAEAGIQSAQLKELDGYLGEGLEYLEQRRAEIDEALISGFLEFFRVLRESGYGDYIEYDASIVRGFDYYTGIVFEVYDLHPENRRSLFGGGRYDNLVGNFSKQSSNAVGFGMGDVTFAEFLQTHGLHREFGKPLDVAIINLAGRSALAALTSLAAELRRKGLNVEQLLSGAKPAKQMQAANDKNAAYALIVGDDELKKGSFTLKDMKTGNQSVLSRDELFSTLVRN